MSTADEPSAGRQLVEEHVSTGRWPHPNDRPCHDCGHVWFEGERWHAYDVDHLDQPPDDPADVHVVCLLCHDQRSFERGEETGGEWRKHW